MGLFDSISQTANDAKTWVSNKADQVKEWLNKKNDSSTNQEKILTSLWDGLNTNLIAEFFVVEQVIEKDSETNKQKSIYWRKKEGEPVVKAPLSEINMEITQNWTNPFENAGTENKAPALFALIQSGGISNFVTAVSDYIKDKDNPNTVNEAATNIGQNIEGRSGITKLNSTQIFTGMQPITFTLTAVFRAWLDAQSEVVEPFDQLVKWSLPREMKGAMTITELLAENQKKESNQEVDKTKNWINTLLPSKSPVRIGMKYKGYTYMPLVIESLSANLGSPINVNGKYVQINVDMTITSLTAMDERDWADFKEGKAYARRPVNIPTKEKSQSETEYIRC